MTKPIYLFSISSHPNAISINSLDITFFKPSIDFSQYDYVILTSKQASKALQAYEFDSYKNKGALCISKATANSFKVLGGHVLEVGSGYGDRLISKIKSYPKATKWLYLRAEVVASDFVEVCKADGYCIEEAIVYKSGCSQAIELVEVEANATLIFTSPSSVQCFLNKHSIMETNRVIVIGKTTAKSLPSNIHYTISKETTIASCMELLQ